jgi:competence protein ComEC
VRKPLFYIAIGISCGIAIEGLIGIPFFYIFTATAAAVLISITARNSRWSVSIVSAAVVLCGALLLANANLLAPDHISHIAKDEPASVFLRGRVANDPSGAENFYGQKRRTFLLRTEWIRLGKISRPSSGLIMVDMPDDGSSVEFLDQIVLEGELSTIPAFRNPGAFDYDEYMKRKGVYALLRVRDADAFHVTKGHKDIIRSSAYRLRRAIRVLINKYFNIKDAALLEAVMIGDRSKLTQGTKEGFVKTGTVHILAISGLHVGLIAAIFLALLKFLRIPKKPRYIAVIFIIVFYALISGSNPPVLRASIIFAILVMGYILEREPQALNSLGAAAVLILIANPNNLFDASFQLSFVAILSIILIEPNLKGIFGIEEKAPSKSRMGRAGPYLVNALSVSIAAFLGTAPFIARYFNIISPVSILANIVIIPMLFFLMSALVAFLIAAFLFGPSVSYFALVTSWIEKILFAANNVFLKFPFAYVRIPSPSAATIGLYCASLFFLLSRGPFRFGGVTIPKRRISMVVLFVWSAFVWTGAARENDGCLRATFLDVGHGDSIYIEFPGGGNMLIDGGKGALQDRFDIGASIVGPFLWNRGAGSIDAVVLTHPDEDHMGGLLYILENFKVGCVIDNGWDKTDSAVYKRYVEIMKTNRTRRVTASGGDEISGFGSSKVYVLNPPENINESMSLNDASLVLKVVSKNTSILLCGDVGEKGIKNLISEHGKALKSDILVVPHHGGKVGSEEALENFLTLVRPKEAVISSSRSDLAKANPRRMIDMLTSLKSNGYETGTDGAVTLVSDGENYRIYTYNQKSAL